MDVAGLAVEYARRLLPFAIDLHIRQPRIRIKIAAAHQHARERRNAHGDIRRILRAGHALHAPIRVGDGKAPVVFFNLLVAQLQHKRPFAPRFAKAQRRFRVEDAHLPALLQLSFHRPKRPFRQEGGQIDVRWQREFRMRLIRHHGEHQVQKAVKAFAVGKHHAADVHHALAVAPAQLPCEIALGRTVPAAVQIGVGRRLIGILQCARPVFQRILIHHHVIARLPDSVNRAQLRLHVHPRLHQHAIARNRRFAAGGKPQLPLHPVAAELIAKLAVVRRRKRIQIGKHSALPIQLGQRLFKAAADRALPAVGRQRRHAADAHHGRALPVKVHLVGDGRDRADHSFVIIKERGPVHIPVHVLPALRLALHGR